MHRSLRACRLVPHPTHPTPPHTPPVPAPDNAISNLKGAALSGNGGGYRAPNYLNPADDVGTAFQRGDNVTGWNRTVSSSVRARRARGRGGGAWTGGQEHGQRWNGMAYLRLVLVQRHRPGPGPAHARMLECMHACMREPCPAALLCPAAFRTPLRCASSVRSTRPARSTASQTPSWTGPAPPRPRHTPRLAQAHQG